MRLFLATRNPGKVTELSDLLDGLPVEVLPCPEFVPPTVEDTDSLEGNAAKKAHEVCAATGAAALADDTGLFVDALDGAPGVDTAEFGGPRRLLEALGDRSPRSARFRTVLVVAYPDGRPDLVVSGVAEGHIARELRGEHGFGYDPIFVPADGDGRTFAEMDPSEKGRLSHRGRALRALVGALGGSSRPERPGAPSG